MLAAFFVYVTLGYLSTYDAIFDATKLLYRAENIVVRGLQPWVVGCSRPLLEEAGSKLQKLGISKITTDSACVRIKNEGPREQKNDATVNLIVWNVKKSVPVLIYFYYRILYCSQAAAVPTVFQTSFVTLKNGPKNLFFIGSIVKKKICLK